MARSTPQTISAPAILVKNKGLLTAALMLATIMQVLDTTIANVALPHMAASLGAAQNEITWVLTSYIVAAAIATPLTGWLADRLGQKRLFLIAVIGFTVASALCGIAGSLPEMVIFRVIQGLFGAIIAPLAQTVLLNINPKEKIGQAMAIYGMGIMVAPIIGPTLGGYLTESFDWRWVFLINLPVGIAAAFMLFAFMPVTDIKKRRFDFFGFAMLAMSVGALQLMLDRGADNFWFASVETWIVVGITLFSGLALLPPLLQNLMGYPVMFSSVIMAPRGFATLISMMIVGRLSGKVDARIMMLFGTACMAYSLYGMTSFNLEMDYWPVITTGVMQGFGMGFLFVPLSTMAFSTIAPRFRGDATSMFALVRNMGQGVGISVVTAVLASMMQVNHAELAARITATSQAVMNQVPGLLTGSPTVVATINGLVTQQAAMLAYLDDFWLMLLLSLGVIPLILVMRGPKKAERPQTEEEKALERAHAMAD